MNRPLFLAALVVALASPGAADAEERKAAPKGEELTSAEVCRQRFAALCQVVRRCAPGASEDLGGEQCEGIDPGCDHLAGARTTYPRAAVDQCVRGLEKTACPKGARTADPSELAQIDFEAQVKACRALPTEAKAGTRKVPTTATASR